MSLSLTPEAFDDVLQNLEDCFCKLEGSRGSVVKLSEAELNLLGLIASARDFMNTILQMQGNRSDLENIFGGDCARIARTRAVLEAAKFSDISPTRQRFSTCLNACESVERVLSDLGFGMTLRQAQQHQQQVPLHGKRSNSPREPALVCMGELKQPDLKFGSEGIEVVAAGDVEIVAAVDAEPFVATPDAHQASPKELNQLVEIFQPNQVVLPPAMEPSVLAVGDAAVDAEPFVATPDAQQASPKQLTQLVEIFQPNQVVLPPAMEPTFLAGGEAAIDAEPVVATPDVQQASPKQLNQLVEIFQPNQVVLPPVMEPIALLPEQPARAAPLRTADSSQRPAVEKLDPRAATVVQPSISLEGEQVTGASRTPEEKAFRATSLSQVTRAYLLGRRSNLPSELALLSKRELEQPDLESVNGDMDFVASGDALDDVEPIFATSDVEPTASLPEWSAQSPRPETPRQSLSSQHFRATPVRRPSWSVAAPPTEVDNNAGSSPRPSILLETAQVTRAPETPGTPKTPARTFSQATEVPEFSQSSRSETPRQPSSSQHARATPLRRPSWSVVAPPAQADSLQGLSWTFAVEKVDPKAAISPRPSISLAATQTPVKTFSQATAVPVLSQSSGSETPPRLLSSQADSLQGPSWIFAVEKVDPKAAISPRPCISLAAAQVSHASVTSGTPETPVKTFSQATAVPELSQLCRSETPPRPLSSQPFRASPLRRPSRSVAASPTEAAQRPSWAFAVEKVDPKAAISPRPSISLAAAQVTRTSRMPETPEPGKEFFQAAASPELSTKLPMSETPLQPLSSQPSRTTPVRHPTWSRAGSPQCPPWTLAVEKVDPYHALTIRPSISLAAAQVTCTSRTPGTPSKNLLQANASSQVRGASAVRGLFKHDWLSTDTSLTANVSHQAAFNRSH